MGAAARRGGGEQPTPQDAWSSMLAIGITQAGRPHDGRSGRTSCVWRHFLDRYRDFIVRRLLFSLLRARSNTQRLPSQSLGKYAIFTKKGMPMSANTIT